MEARIEKKEPLQNNIIIESPNENDKIIMAAIFKACCGNLKEFFTDIASDYKINKTKKEIEPVKLGIALYIHHIFAKELNCLVARSRETKKVIGIITYKKIYAENNEYELLCINALAVDPQNQKNKTAQRLIDSVVKLASEQNCTEIKAVSIGTSHTFWEKHFYPDLKDFYLHKARYQNYHNFVSSNEMIKLFPFIAESKNEKLIATINQAKNIKLLKAAHIFSHHLAKDDLLTGIPSALSCLVKYLIKHSDIQTPNDLFNNDYYMLFQCIVEWSIAHKQKISLNEILTEAFAEYKDVIDSQKEIMLTQHLEKIGLTKTEELEELSNSEVKSQSSSQSRKRKAKDITQSPLLLFTHEPDVKKTRGSRNLRDRQKQASL